MKYVYPIIYMFDQLYLYNSDLMGMPIDPWATRATRLSTSTGRMDTIPDSPDHASKLVHYWGVNRQDARFVITKDGRDELVDWSPHPDRCMLEMLGLFVWAHLAG
jgi:hypothetical protein